MDRIRADHPGHTPYPLKKTSGGESKASTLFKDPQWFQYAAKEPLLQPSSFTKDLPLILVSSAPESES